MESLKKLLKRATSACLVLALYFSSPVIGDHLKDIYLNEIVRKKANPISYRGRVFGSSFQLTYKRNTLTVTNHHVCNVVQKIQRDKDLQSLDNYLMVLALRGVPPKHINKLYIKRRNSIMSKSYPVVGQYLTVGDYSRKIVFMSRSHDICFLQPTGGMSFSLASRVDNGERVTIIGHPRGQEQSISDGRITNSVINEHPTLRINVRSLKSTALSYPGNSGSPVVNRYGNVVGILYAGYPSDYTNVNFVVPMDFIKADFEQYLYERHSIK